MAKETKKARRKLLEAARKHQDALQAAGLSATVIDRYENALKGIEAQGKLSAAATVLVRDLKEGVEELQAAMGKEFPGNSSFLGGCSADEPMPKARARRSKRSGAGEILIVCWAVPGGWGASNPTRSIVGHVPRSRRARRPRQRRRRAGRVHPRGREAARALHGGGRAREDRRARAAAGGRAVVQAAEPPRA